MIQRTETTAEPIAEGRTDPGSAGHDHLLLVLKAVINDTRVSALVDSGATRSFVSEQLHTRPPMEFIGAYSLLELANGQTIVATGIAPNVLVSIGGTVSRVSLTAVPMMEGIQVILGRDWLDTVNPLVDWRTNSLVLRSGDKLEVVQGLKMSAVKRCNIVDRGLAGLQHTFLSSDLVADPASKWGAQYTELCSPSFWEPHPTVGPWTRMSDRCASVGPDSPGTAESPQGGVTKQISPKPNEKPQDEFKGVHRKQIKVAGRVISQPKRPKLDVISMRQATRWANKTDLPMYLCLVRPSELPMKSKNENQGQSWCSKRPNRGRKTSTDEGNGSTKSRHTDQRSDKSKSARGQSRCTGRTQGNTGGIQGNFSRQTAIWTTQKAYT